MTTDERNNFSDANDVDRIMEIAQANDNPHELIHLVQDNADAIFTWNYDKGERAKLCLLYTSPSPRD